MNWKIDEWTVRQDDFSKLAVIYSGGLVYAMRFSLDSDVTEERVRKSWNECRRLWKPYDEATGLFRA